MKNQNKNKISLSPKITAVFKMFMLALYCTLICAAILFSFKSVFNAVTGTNSDLSSDFIAGIVNNSEKSEKSVNVLSKIGSTGEKVKDIQEVLKDMGYYSGEINGIFGVETQEAVMKFQRANKIPSDGIVDSHTLKALGLQ